MTANALTLAMDGGVAVVSMNDPADEVNTLKLELLDEFEAMLDRLETSDDIEAVVFTSAKPDSFIAGANLDMLKAVERAADAEALSRAAQRLQARIERLPKPKAAAINGACLGGGLEFTLSFDVRIASDDEKTRLGLPEVQLGLLPGGGGTQRLPRLVGVEAALDLLLTGRQLSAGRAMRIGLVDAVVPKTRLLEAAVARVRERLDPVSATRPAAADLTVAQRLRRYALERNPFGRAVVFNAARKRTLAKTRGHYPAPEEILDVVRTGLDRGLEAGLDAEARAFGELVVSPQSRQLVNLFFATTALKKDPGAEGPDAEPRAIRAVGVLGGGLMGAGIAQVTARRAALPVVIKEQDAEGAKRAIAQVAKSLEGRVNAKRMRPDERDAILERIDAAADYAGFGSAEIVVEAVFEDLALKQQMLKEVERIDDIQRIFATNTSSIPIASVAEASERPEHVIGMHYFSPVEKMPLLEVVVTGRTAPWVTATSVALGKAQGKTVIVVRDGPGFYTSRVLAPYLNEAAYLLGEGVRIDAIDQALVDFGFPVGPLTLLDEVGIDVAAKVGRVLEDALGARLQPPAGMGALIADKRFGRKNGRGFYHYDGRGKRVDESVYAVLGSVPAVSLPPSEIASRCTLTMVNEAARCLEEAIVRSARDGDVGAVFGLGFPPFLGGPFAYADALGADQIVERLEGFAARLGPRFEPAPMLRQHARAGTRFHAQGRERTSKS